MNGYARLIPASLYDRMPKAVLAALAVSLVMQRGDEGGCEIHPDDATASEDVTKTLLAEWSALNLAGVVPQKPVKP